MGENPDSIFMDYMGWRTRLESVLSLSHHDRVTAKGPPPFKHYRRHCAVKVQSFSTHSLHYHQSITSRFPKTHISTSLHHRTIILPVHAKPKTPKTIPTPLLSTSTSLSSRTTLHTTSKPSISNVQIIIPIYPKSPRNIRRDQNWIFTTAFRNLHVQARERVRISLRNIQ